MITSFFACILGIVLIRASFAVINARRREKISFGSGPNNEIDGPVAAHSNFVAYTPFLLILFYLLEDSGLFHAAILYALGATFTLGRIYHFRACARPKCDFKKRILGMKLTFFPMIFMLVANFGVWVIKTFSLESMLP